jgi:hypothetical protein
MIVFLDFEGVLHPNKVYMTKTGVVLRCDGHNLFEHAELLADLLEPYPDVRIVLSTSWVWGIGFDDARACLLERLQARIHGTTYDCESEDKNLWQMYSRWFQIHQYVKQNHIDDWLAIDDDDRGWPDDKRHHLIHTNEWGGIGMPDTQAKLIEGLERL